MSVYKNINIKVEVSLLTYYEQHKRFEDFHIVCIGYFVRHYFFRFDTKIRS